MLPAVQQQWLEHCTGGWLLAGVEEEVVGKLSDPIHVPLPLLVDSLVLQPGSVLEAEGKGTLISHSSEASFSLKQLKAVRTKYH